MDHPTFGRWLKLRRRSLGLTQAQLGQQIGYAGETIRKVEADELRPSRSMAEKLAEALGIAAAEHAAFLRFARDESGSDAVSLPVQATGVPIPVRQQPHHPVRLAPIRESLSLPRDPLIGREWEVTAIQSLLLRSHVGLVTLTGPGGVGKTRLAIQVAANLHDKFAGGVCFVSLAPVDDPTLVVSTITQTLGVREIEGQSLQQSLQMYLHDKQLLLILDNFEQVARAGPLISDLLHAAPKLKVLVTSRVVLHLRAEHIFAVPPLALPTRDAYEAQTTAPTGTTHTGQHAGAAHFMQSAAVRLFIERAQAARADFAVTDENARAIAEICHRLDGLPLAIELAAARVRLLSPKAMLAQLENQLQFLTGGAHDLPARQQTMRATLAWSYALLDEMEKILLRRLAVFTGGFTLTAVQEVCNLDGALPDTLGSVASLIDKSLLQQKAETSDEPRFTLLRVIREYALEQLAEHGEAMAFQRAHADFFLALAEQAGPKLTGAEQQVWLGRLGVEYDNLRTALETYMAEHSVALGLRLGGALWRFWEVRGYHSEGRLWLERVLAEDVHLAPLEDRARALVGAGRLACHQGDYATACLLHEESLRIYREVGNRQGTAFSLNNLGNIAFNQGDYGAARRLHEESLALYRETGDRWGIGAALNNLGNIAIEQGDYEAARRLHEESLAVKRELGDKQGIASSLNNLGNVALNQGDYRAARRLHEESLAMKRELGDKQGIATSLNNLGNIALYQGDYRAAHALLEESLALQRVIGNKRGAALALYNLGEVAHHEGDNQAACTLYKESLAIRQEVSDKQGIAECLAGLAGVAKACQQLEKAARLFAATETLLQATGACLETGSRTNYDNNVAAVKRALGEDRFAAAWAEGRAMTPEQVIADVSALDSFPECR